MNAQLIPGLVVNHGEGLGTVEAWERWRLGNGGGLGTMEAWERGRPGGGEAWERWRLGNGGGLGRGGLGTVEAWKSPGEPPEFSAVVYAIYTDESSTAPLP